MAPYDERKLKDKAHALVRDGKLKEAVDIYLKVIAVNRTDPALRLKHAELCQRLGRTDAAVASYRVAAHLMTEAGHITKAHAALSCAVKLAPTDLALRRAMRQLHDVPTFSPMPAPPPALKTNTVEIAAVVVPLGDDELPTETNFALDLARPA